MTRSRQQSSSSIDLSAMVYGKVPPNASPLEAAILGGVLMDQRGLDIAQEVLRPECFYLGSHQLIYTVMQVMAAAGRKIDTLTLVEELRRRGELDRVGGAYFITTLTNNVVSSANIEEHSRIVLEKFIAREQIRVGGQMMADAYEDSTDVFDLLDKAETELYNISNHHIKRDFSALDSVLVEEVKRLEELRHKDELLTGVPLGFPGMEACTSGWQNTDLIILAARPSVGKTAFALNLARNAAMDRRKPTPVAFFSLEMSKRQLVQRLIAREAGLNLQKIKNARLDDAGMKALYDTAIVPLAGARIYIDDTAALNIFELRAKARRLKSKYKVGLIVIDYLQLMSGDTNRSDNREREISKISRELKKLAKDLEVPIIALSQLSREVEKRGKGQKVPQLSDLRESGAIEQDADLVAFLYRPPDDEVAEDASLAGTGMAKIAKHRNGELKTFAFEVNNALQHWTELGDLDELKSRAAAQAGHGNWKPVNIRDTSQPNPPAEGEQELPF